MKSLPILALALTLVFFLSVVVTAQDSSLPQPTDVPNLPPGTDTDNFDIVEWLTWVAGPASGALVAWFLEKTKLSQYVGLLKPEAKRNVSLIISGVFGVAACGLLSLVTQLPEGSVTVINALLAMVFSQVAHGRLALGKSEG